LASNWEEDVRNMASHEGEPQCIPGNRGQQADLEWTINSLTKNDQRFLLMEPGTCWEVKNCEIHACITLTPSVHACQEFFYIEDAGAILEVWKATKGAWKKYIMVSSHFFHPFFMSRKIWNQ
jgi:hypothetical protein